MYMSSQTAASSEQKKILSNANVTFPQIQEIIDLESSKGLTAQVAYGLSKACIAAYTMILARTNPRIYSSTITPGFIQTAITKGMGAKLTPRTRHKEHQGRVI